jgi:flagellar biosynthesis/type III secretory pathway protein FliH
MTGYQSKKAAALDEEGMYLVHHTKRKDDDDDAQGYIAEYESALQKEYQRGYEAGKAAQQEPDAYGYARRLAVAIWEQHYKATAPHWKPLDDLMGVLTQIDNMTAGLTAQRQPHYDKTEMKSDL